MKLLELYSLSTGLKIGRQDLAEAFYPLDCARYVTIQSGSGMAAKNYPFYDEVVELLKPHLAAAGIDIVQLGGPEDAPIAGCTYHLQGKTNLHQSNYVLSRAVFHVGNDSWMAHRAGEKNVPVVISYGPTDPKNHAPYRSHPKSAFIQSHRFGRRPTFAAQEAPATIALIPPEQIANAALDILGLPRIARKSLYIGPAYQQRVVELVPDSVVAPGVQVNGPLIVRMDLAEDWQKAEGFLAGNLQIRPCVILTDREVNPNLLTQFKPNVRALRVQVDKVSIDWLRAIKRLGVPTAYFSNERDPEKLAKLRLDLFDLSIYFDQFLPPTREDFVKGARVYTNDPALDTLSTPDKIRFKTHKLLLSNGKIYLSEAHWRAGKPTPDSAHNTGEIIDNETFWTEQEHFYAFYE